LKADETSKSDSPESGLIQHTRENLREAANNLKDVFSLKRSCVLMNKVDLSIYHVADSY